VGSLKCKLEVFGTLLQLIISLSWAVLVFTNNSLDYGWPDFLLVITGLFWLPEYARCTLQNHLTAHSLAGSQIPVHSRPALNWDNPAWGQTSSMYSSCDSSRSYEALTEFSVAQHACSILLQSARNYQNVHCAWAASADVTQGLAAKSLRGDSCAFWVTQLEASIANIGDNIFTSHTGSCEHGNEPSGSVKGEEFLDELRNCWLLKKDSAPQS
jgi:hypothetical protein